MAYLLYPVLFAFLALHSQHANAAPLHLVPFSKVLDNYPTAQTSDAQFLSNAKLSSRITGATDALRVSHALFQSGYAITIGNNQYAWSRTVTTDCARYIATADTMQQYLTNEIGSPFVGSKQEDFQNKKGIVTFQGCTGNQADYVDLMYPESNGTPQCKKQACSFDDCTNIKLFELI